MDRPPVSAFLRAVLPLVLLLLPGLAPAQEFSLVSDTLLRIFERDTDRSDGLAIPVYEYLQLDAGDPEKRSLTFHLYGWGRADFGDGGYYDDLYGSDTGGELLYGYLQYVRPETDLDIRLGRQYVFEGVSNESVDGLRIGSNLGEYFGGSIYAGQPVSLDSEEGRDGDYIFGGRLSHRLRSLYEVGVSYKNIGNDDDQTDERAGVDFSLFLPAGVSLFGFSSYNLESDDWAEHSYEANFNLGPLRLRPFFEHYRFDDYFDAGDKTPGPFRFLVGRDEKLTVLGGDVLWQKAGGVELGARFKNYDYDERDETAQFYSLLGNWTTRELTQFGGELGRMDGETDETRYFLARAYAYYDQIKLPLLRFVTGDVVYVFYDEDIEGEDTSLTLSLGAGSRFLNDRLEIRVAGDYSTDPYFDDDLRGWLMARLSYGR